MPFANKPRNPDADRLLAAAVDAHRQVAEAQRERQRAIRRALHAGATLRELGRALEASPETIRKWGTTNPKS